MVGAGGFIHETNHRGRHSLYVARGHRTPSLLLGQSFGQSGIRGGQVATRGRLSTLASAEWGRRAPLDFSLSPRVAAA
jgi:hypothetical protein